MKKNILIGLILIVFYSCSDDSESDRRAQYIGDYHFTVKKCSYGWVVTDTGTVVRYDTINFEFDGNIEKYYGNRILIKYSPEEALGRCVTYLEAGHTWCQGYVGSACIDNCQESNLFFVEDWITPVLKDNDSLILFEEYSLINGKGAFVTKDSIYFELKGHEKTYGSDEYIAGARK